MIRKAKVSEIQKIMEMTRACAAKMISEGILQWNEHYPSKIAFETDLRREELFVLTSEENVLGSITISEVKDAEYDPISWLTQDGNNYYIHRLAVHPAAQHQGNAKKLMDFAEDYAASKKGVSVRLDTFSQNKRNQQFYKARGYVQLGDIFFPKQSKHPFHCFELVLSESKKSVPDTPAGQNR